MPSSVLVVEDNRQHREIFSTVLRAHDYQPVEISDPRTAFSTALTSDPAAIIVDILLPYVDGRVLIGELQADARTWHIPIIAVSAAADPEMADSCLAAGADRFRAKPVPLLVLVDDLHQLTSLAG